MGTFQIWPRFANIVLRPPFRLGHVWLKLYEGYLTNITFHTRPRFAIIVQRPPFILSHFCNSPVKATFQTWPLFEKIVQWPPFSLGHVQQNLNRGPGSELVGSKSSFQNWNSDNMITGPASKLVVSFGINRTRPVRKISSEGPVLISWLCFCPVITDWLLKVTNRILFQPWLTLEETSRMELININIILL